MGLRWWIRVRGLYLVNVICHLLSTCDAGCRLGCWPCLFQSIFIYDSPRPLFGVFLPIRSCYFQIIVIFKRINLVLRVFKFLRVVRFSGFLRGWDLSAHLRRHLVPFLLILDFDARLFMRLTIKRRYEPFLSSLVLSQNLVDGIAFFNISLMLVIGISNCRFLWLLICLSN